MKKPGIVFYAQPLTSCPEPAGQGGGEVHFQYRCFEIRDKFDVMSALACFNYRVLKQTRTNDIKMRSSAIRSR